jgi:dTDP-4-dehydrorhamnose reductase
VSTSWLVTGAGGQLGHDLLEVLSRRAGDDVTPVTRAEADLTDEASVRDVVRGWLGGVRGRGERAVVVNAAAYTAVDDAEADEATAQRVNGDAPGWLAEEMAGHGRLVHVSTDYVFDGRKREPYVESDEVAPMSAYGRSKLAGEVSVRQEAGDRHTIVRSSWLFGAGGPCFPATMLRLAAERDELTVVDDQVGCPTFTGHLASALVSLALSRPLGVVHVAGGGACSWFDLARETIASAGLSCEVKRGRTEDLGRPAPRPAYSVLASERGEVVPRLPEWRAGLAEYLSAAVPSR